MFNKVLIANRGEIAVRIIRACREMGIRTVAVYSQADAAALHTRLADEAVLLGPAPANESYLRGDRIIAAALQTGCQAIHPGYGFLAENAKFAAAVIEAGLTFIGPSPEVIRLMGSKTAARELMQAAGVPVAPGYHAESGGAEEQGSRGERSPKRSFDNRQENKGLEGKDEGFLAAAEEIGYPLLVKAVAGGGGKGMRLVSTATELPNALQSARREALHAFGDERVYLEKYLAQPRHIEFQILADAHGHVVHLFERECSLQRRHQKIIEETPSPLLTRDETLRQRMGQAAVAAAQAVNYVNAGTIEFLVDAQGNFYFLEMNTRLQVEHPITELVTGLDLVKWQLRIAAGEKLPFTQADLSQRGHALECRIYAEDPANDFLPATGRVLYLVEPAGPGVRVDSGLVRGDEVTPHYDPLLAKLIVLGENRPEAIQKMAAALRQYVLLGVTTNLTFLRDLLAHESFQRGETTTGLIEQHFGHWQPAQDSPPDLVLIAAALGEMLEGGEEARRRGGEEMMNDPYNPWRELSNFRIGEVNQK
ncbi:MAG: acetyl-CoA carboxylase biotin carboxylase subunit [Anaerolineae bacterium]|nr:ATP-grasp domain-containing protein [Anaerolineales bacterium]MCQ3978275.1 acetyl-CoA carboxylase biotin carboxylase subunit [Anaerolineae bacterium]